jgi:Pentapeptide repeats (8 copies)
MNKMKKNILQLSIVFIAVLVFSTMTMAGGKKHYHHKWWNPLSGLWSAIYQLEDQMNNMNKRVNDKLASLSQAGGTNPGTFPGLDSGAGPLVCPGCYFPAGDLDDEYKVRLKGAFLPWAKFGGTDLSNADLSNADLRGAGLADCDFYGADFTNADLSPVPFVTTSGKTDLQTDFSRANLEKANLIEAKGLDTVKWFKTICPDGSNSDDNDGDNKTCSEKNLQF